MGSLDPGEEMELPACGEGHERRLARKALRVRPVLLAVLVVLSAIAVWVRVIAPAVRPPKPQLTMPHPAVEYLLTPNVSMTRDGRRYVTNSHSMRSEEFPRERTDADELRILVFGDSVTWGDGPDMDNDELATAVLKARLRRERPHGVIVGNVSAPSWGPVNHLAYATEFGLFDADLVLLVLNSPDARDCPPADKGKPGVCLDAILSLARECKSSGADIAIIQHWTRDEVDAGELRADGLSIRRTCEDAHIPVWQDGPCLRARLQGGENPFMDSIHLSTMGQRALGELLHEVVCEMLPERP